MARRTVEVADAEPELPLPEAAPARDAKRDQGAPATTGEGRSTS